MDFGSLLYKAQKNEQNSKQNSGWYKTTFAPPKKEQREKKLSVNIQKFLAKKEEEEKRKRLEAEKKKQELLFLRNKDKKSFKRVQMMLTKTKSANKSVIEDAVDNVNTAVTANGPLQPDEDDYGYVSKDASELYDKLISKYSNMPSDEPAFSKSSTKVSKDISTTKDRVKAALQREEEEKFLPRKRKRKSKTDGDEEDDKSDEEKPEEKRDDAKSQNKPEKFKIPKRNVAQPPPIDFQSLLKLAEKKQHEPIVIETKVVEKPERPMTQKEKIEYMREKERRMRKEMGISESAYRANELLKKKDIKTKSEVIEKTTSSASKPAPAERLKSNANSSSSLNGSVKKTPAPDAPPQKLKTASSSIKKPKIDDVKGNISKEQKTSTNAEKPAPAIGVLSERQKMILAHKRNSELETKRMAELEARKREAKLNRINQSEELPRERLSNLSNHTPLKNSKSELPRSKVERFGAVSPPRSKDVSSAKTTEFKKPISSVQSRQFPPPDVMPKQFPPPDVKRKQFPPPDVIRKPAKPVVRRKVIESDDEYDSEMDDFIDDTEDPTDISSIISDIFKYDRRKYAARDYEDDDECMESNFSQLQKEEFISTKYGILEDLEDVRRTKMQKMRKKKRVM